MRRRVLIIAIIVVAICSLSAATRAENLPKLSLYVNDLTTPPTLLQSESDDITNICLQVDNITTAEIAVLIVNSTGTLGIDMYTAQTFQQNGIGKAGQNNGVLILVSMNEKLWRIEVGYGLEGILNATLDIGQAIVDNYQPPPGTHTGNASLFGLDWRSIIIGIVIFIAVAVLTKGKAVFWVGNIFKRGGFGGGESGGGGADG